VVGIVLVLSSGVLTGGGRAEVSTPSEAPGNACHDVQSWREWEALVARNPASHALQTLHALRLGLCLKVERQDLTVDQATVIFETARQALLTQLRDQRQPGKRPGDL
jgi:hypothetical protein